MWQIGFKLRSLSLMIRILRSNSDVPVELTIILIEFHLDDQV